ncbi:MAG: SRPBCC family protein, partial [Nocardioidaceae bacterium]
MSGQFSGSAVINRPIKEVFDYLAEGTNDPEFSPRVLSIRKETDGLTGVGTVFVSQVKDAGMKT